MNTQIKAWGNSQGVRLSKEMLNKAGIILNEILKVDVSEGKITLSKKFCHKTGITIIQKGAKKEKLDKKINYIEYELKLISENQVFSSNI